MSEDELVVFGSYDQELPLEPHDYKLLEKVQQEINTAADNHDVERAVQICVYFQRATKLSGKSLAQALHTMYKRWNDFGIGEEFIDYIFARIGVARHTVERYLRVAVLLETVVPDQYRTTFESMGIQRLVPIAHAAAQGYEIEPEEWEALANTTTYAEVREVVNQQIKGVAPREGALKLSINREGTLLVFQGENSPKYLGNLEINSDDPAIQQAVERIIRNSGILQS